MKKIYCLLKSKSLALISLLMFAGSLQAASIPTCAITKVNGSSCYSTTLTSVTLNSNNTYTIVLTVVNNGAPGPDCKTLSHYSVEAADDTYSNMFITVVSGNMTYNHTIATENIGASTPFRGFKVDGTGGIGDGHAGVFTFTYTLSTLQRQRTDASAGGDDNIATFEISDFETVLHCTQPKVENPVFSLATNTYTTCQTLTLSCPTAGASIYYTTDGTTPDTRCTLYTAPLNISSTTTVKAIAMKEGMNNSDVVTRVYTINLLQVAKPTFSPAPGTFDAAQDVSISCTTAGASIYYTTNGDTPTTASTLYVSGTPVHIEATKTLKAIAVTECMLNSEVAIGSYIITEENHNPFPATGFASVAFEDLWPAKGDYDMNDIVVDCKFDQISNSENKVTKITAQFVLRGMGASFHDGFGIQLPVTPDKVASCVLKLDNGQSVPMAGLVTINSKGLEQGQSKAVVIIFDDGFKVLPQIYNGIGVNTTPGIPWTPTQTINMTLTFSEPIDENLLEAPYNPFIFADQKRGAEIHLPNNPPTNLADMSLFNKDDDTSNVESFGTSNVKSYTTDKNLPWAILFYKKYDYPTEKTPILNAFLHFSDWAQSGGQEYKDWYYNTASGYRDTNKIYFHQ